MTIAISLTLSGLFVFLAGFNLWNMLSGRGASAMSSRWWRQIHRAAGYAFIALYALMCYFMLLRVKGEGDALPAHILLHMTLALSLAPLLFAKVVIARYQKSARGLLTALGIAIFAVTFTLVAIAVSMHFLSVTSTQPVSTRASAMVVTLVLAIVAGFLLNGKRLKPESEINALGISKNSGQEPSNRVEPLDLRLARIEPQTRDAKTFRFLLPPGKHLAARPGQFLTFEWIIDNKPVLRSYSICSSPRERKFIEITAKRVENGFVSRFLNDRATVGLTVKARGPYGQFFFDEHKHRRIVLIAAGSGITPMIAMLHYMDDLASEVPCTLIYCVRTAQELLFDYALTRFQKRLPGFRYVPVLSRGAPDVAIWTGHLRREILEREIEEPLESTFFLCGPPAFMQLGRALLEEMSVDPAQILQESFGTAAMGSSPKPPNAGEFAIKFARSAAEYNSSPNETLLDSSERCGALIPSGCRQGSCGTCATRLLEGEVEMTEAEALTEEMRSMGYILPCVSRPVSDVTLDL